MSLSAPASPTAALSDLPDGGAEAPAPRGKPSRQAAALPVPRVDTLGEFGLMVSRQLTQCRRYGGHLAVLWLEVEPDTHTDADIDAAAPARDPALRGELVTALGRRLRARVRGSDMVLQVGETSFAVLLLDAGQVESAIVQQRLAQVLDGPYGVGDVIAQLGFQMGSAVFPEGGVRGADLAERARANLRDRSAQVSVLGHPDRRAARPAPRRLSPGEPR